MRPAQLYLTFCRSVDSSFYNLHNYHRQLVAIGNSCSLVAFPAPVDFRVHHYDNCWEVAWAFPTMFTSLGSRSLRIISVRTFSHSWKFCRDPLLKVKRGSRTVGSDSSMTMSWVLKALFDKICMDFPACVEPCVVNFASLCQNYSIVRTWFFFRIVFGKAVN